MDASSTTMTCTHLLIIWTLLGVLLIWIFLFAFLALRSEVVKVDEPFKESDALFTPQTSVIHVAQHTVPTPTQVPMYEPVSEAAPFV